MTWYASCPAAMRLCGEGGHHHRLARQLEPAPGKPAVVGDEVYGGNPKLRSALEERQVGYVLAVACSHEVTTGAGKFRADALAMKVPKRAWQKLSAGAGAKGHRFYDWAVIDLAEVRPGSHRLLIRRNRTTGELAYYRCFSPRTVIPRSYPIRSAITVAGIVGVSLSSSRICTSTASTTEPLAGRSYFGGRSLASACFTVFFEMPRCRAIARIGICSARCSLRISAQSSTRITLPS